MSHTTRTSGNIVRIKLPFMYIILPFPKTLKGGWSPPHLKDPKIVKTRTVYLQYEMCTWVKRDVKNLSGKLCTPPTTINISSNTNNKTFYLYLEQLSPSQEIFNLNGKTSELQLPDDNGLVMSFIFILTVAYQYMTRRIVTHCSAQHQVYYYPNLKLGQHKPWVGCHLQIRPFLS